MLTVSEIKGFKPKDKPYYKWDKDGQRGTGKLAVQVTPRGSKCFTFRYFVNGKTKFIQLGVFPELTLLKAREKAKEYGAMLKDGLDPKAEMIAYNINQEQIRQEEAQKGSFEQLINGYVDKLKSDGKRSSERVLKAIEKDVFNVIPKTIKAKDITSNEIKLVLAKMIQRGAAAHSNKIRSYLHAAFNFGLKHDNDPANLNSQVLFGLLYNPVAAVPKQTHADKVGDNWLRLDEVRLLISDQTREHFSPDVFILIKLCIFLGGQRPYEIIASKWSAVDFKARTFEITKDVSKNYRPNLIPLSDSAYTMFQELYNYNGGSEYLFPRTTKTGHLDPNYLNKVIRKFCAKTEFRKFIPRDLRRTAKTLMGEIGISKSLRDRLQNHALNDVSSKHYDRYEYLPEKKKALDAWESNLNRCVYDDNVIFMNKK
ncbi:site-specific integrase [Photobacterium kishitanii]|uniref:tyrosine-type recombinase/integrase n=1 Tax=Photobacterium kishitanii TaxID=318456 RepID=UPI0007EF2DA2|nr:site-specific integrase [Photobacterium kishitanii]OBU22871.1 integrase [Photobacterium kishitanii]PSW68734.1 site-specific integrase [Photobacterium kishitanii]